MSALEKQVLDEIKSVIVKSLIGFILTIITAGIVFYFTTTAKNNEQDYRINKLEQTSARQSEIDIKLNYIQNSIQELKLSIDELNKRKP